MNELVRFLFQVALSYTSPTTLIPVLTEPMAEVFHERWLIRHPIVDLILKMPADWGRGQLESLEFIEHAEDLVLHGNVGCGKTHLAVAIGRLACLNNIPVRFFTASDLLMRLRRAKNDNRLDHELAAIGKARLVIIDEFGHMPIDEEGSRLLFQVISDSYETRSIIHTTNIEFSGWGRIPGDANMAAAPIDRTVHHGRLIRFQGESYRSQHALIIK